MEDFKNFAMYLLIVLVITICFLVFIHYNALSNAKDHWVIIEKIADYLLTK